MAGNGNPGNELTTRQRRAIAALLSASNVAAAATLAGVGERTLFTWLADPAFRLAVREAETDAIDQAARRLAGLGGQAIDTLSETMTDPTGRPADKLRAAQAILDYLLKLRELATLEARVTALETAQGEQHART